MHLFQETTESPAFFSSAFRSLFSALTRSCFRTVSLATRNDHFSFSFTFNFAFNPRDEGLKIKVIIIIIIIIIINQILQSPSNRYEGQQVHKHTVSRKKLCHYTFVHNFDKCWSILIFFHCCILQEICNTTYICDIARHTCHCTTLKLKI